MTARPFSRLEPVSRPDDPARAIATFFVVIAGIAALPAAFYAAVLGILTLGAIAEAKFLGGLAMLGVLGYAMLGFRQLVFYARRARGKMRGSRGWWLSTYFYNLVPLGISVAVLVQDAHVGALVSALWFAILCTLSIVAYAAEDRVLLR